MKYPDRDRILIAVSDTEELLRHEQRTARAVGEPKAAVRDPRLIMRPNLHTPTRDVPQTLMVAARESAGPPGSVGPTT